MDRTWIVARIRAKGLTQQGLAYRMGLSPSALGKKLYCRRPTTLAEGARLAACLDMTAQEVCDHLFCGCVLREGKCVTESRKNMHRKGGGLHVS